MKSVPGKRCHKDYLNDNKVLGYHIKSADKAASSLRGLTPILKYVLLRVKYYQTTFHASKKIFIKEESVGAANLIFFLKIVTAIPVFINHHPNQQPLTLK